MVNMKREINQKYLKYSRYVSPCLIMGIFVLIVFISCPNASANTPGSEKPAIITFELTDFGENEIIRATIMKKGEYGRDGQVRQYQNTDFIRELNEIRYNPCNDNSCYVSSTPTAGGTYGRDELILEVTMQNPEVDVASCYSNPVCERIKGGVITKSGMIDGIFHTDRRYVISIGSLRDGFGERFEVYEKQAVI